MGTHLNRVPAFQLMHDPLGLQDNFCFLHPLPLCTPPAASAAGAFAGDAAD
jgi:hypothetical protein